MSSFGRYSHDVATSAPLSAEEQRTLAQRYVDGRAPEDKQRLIVANLRLVISIARNLGGRRLPDFMDLVQEGNAGLMVAIERFDPSRGITLSAYASIWIRAFILRHLMETRSAVRLTTTREGRRRFFERNLPSDVSLDAPASRDGDAGPARATMLDFLVGDESLRPDLAAEANEDVVRVRDAVARLSATLTERDRAILASRLLCDEPVPLRQFGPTVHLSGERVRQLEKDMLTRLRSYLCATGDGAHHHAA